jgi:hypothetical protein
MFKYVVPKLQLAVDGIFAVILAIFYLILRSSLRALEAELNVLFLASYISLGLGALMLYLIFSMNSRAALFAHATLFPTLGTFYLFLKWMPDVIKGAEGVALYGADPVAFSGSVLVYLILLFGFFASQLTLYLYRKGAVLT